MRNFSTNSLALIVSDKSYDSMDYIRDFKEFTNINRKNEKK
jgi:hypothetical protein